MRDTNVYITMHDLKEYEEPVERRDLPGWEDGNSCSPAIMYSPAIDAEGWLRYGDYKAAGGFGKCALDFMAEVAKEVRNG